MSDAITAISQSMNADLLRLRATGQNIVNANTNGFRATRFLPVNETADSSQLERIPGPEALAEHIALQAGTLQNTGRSLDVALSGNGFFKILTPDGVRYTRDGAFRLDANGNLLTAAGFPVLGENGAIALKDASITINTAGDILKGGVVVDRFAVAAPAPDAVIRASDKSLYSFSADTVPVYTTHQGMLETSNVDVTGEMVRMIEISRHLQSVQRAMGVYDRMLDVGINQLGSSR